MKEIEDRLNDIDAKIENLSLRIERLEKNAGNKDELEKLKQELENLKKYHDQTVIKVTNNKEQIDLILGRLNDITNGYKQGDEKLQKEIDDIKSQIDILLKMPRGEGKADLSGLNDLIKRLNDLENNFNEFVVKVNIDEIYRQLKFLNETKADKKDLDELNEKYNNHQAEIEAINRRLDSLFSQLMSKSSGDVPTINVDFSQYVYKSDFEKHKKENEKEFAKIWEEIEKLKNLIDQIFNILKTKANLSDLEDLKNFLLSKLEELAMACNKKFADKNDTANNLKYLEDQIKKILELLSAKNELIFLNIGLSFIVLYITFIF